MSLKWHPTKNKKLKPGEAPHWYIRITGKRGEKDDYVPFQGTRLEAEAADAAVNGKVAKRSGNPKVIDKLEEFLDWHKDNQSARTHESLQSAFNLMMPYLGHKHIAYLHTRDYEPYKSARLASKIIPKQRNKRKDRKNDPRAETDEQYKLRCEVETRSVSRRTVQIELNHFRAFMRWCKTVEQIDVGDLPISYSKQQQASKEPIVLSLEEIGAILKQQQKTGEDQYLITSLMLLCGLRRNEALYLRKGEIDLSNRMMHVTGKGGKTRTIPISFDFIADKLKERCKKKERHEYLVLNQRTEKPYTNIKKSLKSAAIKAGIDKRVYNHLMRHSFGTASVVAGIQESALQQILGHSDIRMTRHYTHLAGEYLKEQASKLSQMPQFASVIPVIKNDDKTNNN